MTTIRIFIASPGDVQDERQAVRRVAEQVNRTIEKVRGDLHLEVIGWETDAIPGMHEKGPQGKIDDELEIVNVDIVIGIFWRRFGTAVPGAASGTEHEIRHAHAAWQKHRRPDIWLYFNSAPGSPKTSDEAEQWVRVLKFKEEFSGHGIVRDYGGSSAFEHVLFFDLIGLVVREPSKTIDTRSVEDQIGFTVEADPVLVAAEGYTEKTSDLTLRFKVPQQFVHRTINLSIRVFLNATITNRVLYGHTTDFLVLSQTGEVLAESEVAGSSLFFRDIELRCHRGDGIASLLIKNILANANGISVPGKIMAQVVAEADVPIAKSSEWIAGVCGADRH